MLTAAVMIPARYASSRLPGKCLSVVNGRPLLCHAIANARAGDADRRIIVLSEDEQTLGLAKSEGCETVQEPLSLAHADITETRMAEFVLGSILDPPDIVVVIYGNTAFAPPGIVGRLVEAVRAGADYAQSVMPIPTRLHPWRAVDGNLAEFHPGRADEWSQNFPSLYVITAAGMAFRADVLPRLGRTLLSTPGLRRAAVIHEPGPFFDVDSSADLEALACSAA